MKADPRKVATFMFQYNYFPSGLGAPAETAKTFSPTVPTPPKAVSPDTVIDKAAATAPTPVDVSVVMAAKPRRLSN